LIFYSNTTKKIICNRIKFLFLSYILFELKSGIYVFLKFKVLINFLFPLFDIFA